VIEETLSKSDKDQLFGTEVAENASVPEDSNSKVTVITDWKSILAMSPLTCANPSLRANVRKPV
jgi:hypothetical protein